MRRTIVSGARDVTVSPAVAAPARNLARPNNDAPTATCDRLPTLAALTSFHFRCSFYEHLKWFTFEIYQFLL